MHPADGSSVSHEKIYPKNIYHSAKVYSEIYKLNYNIYILFYNIIAEIFQDHLSMDFYAEKLILHFYKGVFLETCFL